MAWEQLRLRRIGHRWRRMSLLSTCFCFFVHHNYGLSHSRQAQDDTLDPEEKKRGFMGRISDMKVRCSLALLFISSYSFFAIEQLDRPCSARAQGHRSREARARSPLPYRGVLPRGTSRPIHLPWQEGTSFHLFIFKPWLTHVSR